MRGGGGGGGGSVRSSTVRSALSESSTCGERGGTPSTSSVSSSSVTGGAGWSEGSRGRGALQPAAGLDPAGLARRLGRRGARCGVCGNPVVQPFCGMTGQPHARRRASRAAGLFDPDVLLLVYTLLPPWDCLRVRIACRAFWRASLHPVLWEGHAAFLESLACLSCSRAVLTAQAQARWRGALRAADAALLGDLRGPLPRFPHLQRNTPLRRYRAYCLLGVRRWRDELAAAVPHDVTVLSDRDGRDLVEWFIEYQLCSTQIRRLKMSDWDDLHDLLNRTGNALHSLRDLLHHHRSTPAASQLVRLRVLRHSMQAFVDVVAKVDQWMNCATEPRHWMLLQQACTQRGWGDLPPQPSRCPVQLVLTMFDRDAAAGARGGELKQVWDAILATAIYDQPPPPDEADDDSPEIAHPCAAWSPCARTPSGSPSRQPHDAAPGGEPHAEHSDCALDPAVAASSCSDSTYDCDSGRGAGGAPPHHSARPGAAAAAAADDAAAGRPRGHRGR